LSNPLRQVVLIISVTALSIGHSAFAGVWRSPRPVNSDGAPFELVQAPLMPCGDSPVSADGLSIEYSVHNISSETLTHVGIEVVSLSPARQVNAYQIYEGPVHLAPGERALYTYASGKMHVSPADHLVMLPYSALGGSLRWRVPDAELNRRTLALKPEQGDEAPAPKSPCLDPAYVDRSSPWRVEIERERRPTSEEGARP